MREGLTVRKEDRCVKSKGSYLLCGGGVRWGEHLKPKIDVGLPLVFKRKFDPLTPFLGPKV